LFLAELFQDDGWSGGNFERPGFKKMLAALEKKKANTVVTVDLSRLGRNMRESSYYAEEYFPERGIHFFTISDGFDTAQENVFAPFQFAMINPVITGKSGAFQTEEGCLSLDGVRPCTRYKEIEVDYLDQNFKKKHGKYTGWTAQIIQHEVDHCNGVVI